MVFAMVEKAGKVVMRDGEQLDSWCVIVNGEVEVVAADGTRSELAMGDSFGVEPRAETQYQKGLMRTLVPDCQFVLVTQEHYVAIMSQLGDQLRRHTDAAGEVTSPSSFFSPFHEQRGERSFSRSCLRRSGERWKEAERAMF